MPEQKETNKAQELAIAHASGPIQVLAGPGSGKTYLTIRRIRHLICHHGISPSKILVITFTKAAALEMQERFLALTDGNFKEVQFGTFHAVYFQILKQSGYGYETKNRGLSLASTAERRGYLRHILLSLGQEDEDKEQTESLLQRISRRKNGLPETEATPEETQEDLFSPIYEEYCRILREENKLDFDDMILLCAGLLEREPSMRIRWQQRFSHILVDEFQDISPLQYRVLKLLAKPEDNLFVVGDDDQSIYGFRGTGPDIMKQFLEDYREAKQLLLDINYRSGEAIVRAASRLIAGNRNRFPKGIKAAKTEAGEVKISAFSTKEEEYGYLLACLKRMSEEERAQSAVICRTNSQLASFSRWLAKENLPFSLKNRVENIFTHEIGRDLLAYLQFAGDLTGSPAQKGRRSDLLRIMNKPCRYICRAALGEELVGEKDVADYYREKPYMQETVHRLFAQLKRLAALRPCLAVDYIRKGMGYDGYLCSDKKEEEQCRQMELADEIQKTALPFRTFREWSGYIAAYSDTMAGAEDGKAGEKRRKESMWKKESTGKKESMVSLVTMHGSKGLEYDNVFLPDIRAGIIPGKKAVSIEQIEEERRLLYVAMTRAKKRLEILYWGEPSCLLDEKWDQSTSSSNSALSRYSSNASATSSYSSSSSIYSRRGCASASSISPSSK